MHAIFLAETFTLDTATVTEIMELVKSIISVLTTKPLSYFFYAGLIGIGIGIFRGLKQA